METLIFMGFGDYIRDLRKSAKLSQQEFADKVGVSRGFVSQLETEFSSPGPETIVSMTRVLQQHGVRVTETEMFKEAGLTAVKDLPTSSSDPSGELAKALLNEIIGKWSASQGLPAPQEPSPISPKTEQQFYFSAGEGIISERGKIFLRFLSMFGEAKPLPPGLLPGNTDETQMVDRFLVKIGTEEWKPVLRSGQEFYVREVTQEELETRFRPGLMIVAGDHENCMAFESLEAFKAYGGIVEFIGLLQVSYLDW